MRNGTLRHGDVVEVASAAEILATLDEQGKLDGLPFMPEMLQYCGRRFTVDKRAEKLCDTIHYTGSRRLPDSVLLEDLRCDGSGHDGCQAACRLFWKEAWLRRVEGETVAAGPTDGTAAAALSELTARNARRIADGASNAGVRYQCQATELTAATERLQLWDPRAYVREYTSGNVPLRRFLRVVTRAAVEEPLRKLGLMPEIHLPGTRTEAAPEPVLNLRPGEWVRVKSKEEIATTLTPQGRNRGLWFDREMLPYCGGTFRVRSRIRNFIDDHTGKMIELKTEAVTLEGVVCSGDLSLRRWFCPRAIYPYWRESWLERVSAQVASAGTAPQAR